MTSKVERMEIHNKVRSYCAANKINAGKLAAETGLSNSCCGKLLAPRSNKNATRFLNNSTAEILQVWLDTNPERRSAYVEQHEELKEMIAPSQPKPLLASRDYADYLEGENKKLLKEIGELTDQVTKLQRIRDKLIEAL